MYTCKAENICSLRMYNNIYFFRLAGNNVVLRVYVIEFLPMKRRGFCLVALDVLGVIGYVSALGKDYKGVRKF